MGLGRELTQLIFIKTEAINQFSSVQFSTVDFAASDTDRFLSILGGAIIFYIRIRCPFYRHPPSSTVFAPIAGRGGWAGASTPRVHDPPPVPS